MLTDFRIERNAVEMLADILRACKAQDRATVYYVDEDKSIDGVVRHIVSPNDFTLPKVITPDCRLRVTAGAELFIPLRQIEDLTYDESGLFINVESPA